MRSALRLPAFLCLTSLGLVVSAVGVACSDAVDNTPAGATGDSGVDTGARTDAGSSTDGATVLDGGPADATTDADLPKPIVFPLSTGGHDRLYGVTFDSQGNVFAVGNRATTMDAAEDTITIVVKFSPKGVLDTSFGSNGVATVNLALGTGGEISRGIAFQSTGKIVVYGEGEHSQAGDARDRDAYLARFDTNGTIDRTFGSNGVANLDFSDGEVSGSAYIRDGHAAMVVGANDVLYLSGTAKGTGRLDTDFALAKLDANGRIDANFGDQGMFFLDLAGGTDTARGITLLPGDAILAGGYSKDANGIVIPVLYKVTSAGARDTTFGTNGVYNEAVFAAVFEVYAAAPQGPNFVTAGYGRQSTTENLDWVSIRVSATGARDTSYGTNGVARVDFAGQADNARAIAVLPDERVAIVGGSRATSTNANASVIVLTKNGQLDTSFGDQGKLVHDLGGPGDFFWATAVSPDKKTLAAVGLRGVDPDSGQNDDAALLLLPLP
jgi:uncharacterized delta-60 repeat protein